MTLPSRFAWAGASKDTSAARTGVVGAAFFALICCAFDGAFTGSAAGALRAFAGAGFVSRSWASWRENSERPAAGPATVDSAARTSAGAAATPASATPAASVPSCLPRACVRALSRRWRLAAIVDAAARLLLDLGSAGLGLRRQAAGQRHHERGGD